MINEKDKTKFDKWIQIEATINSIFFCRWIDIRRSINSVFWHLNACEENGAHPCRPFLLNRLKIIKSNYDCIDNTPINFKRNLKGISAMINKKDKTKLDKWTEIETRINNIFWHLKVSEENETHPCRLVLLNELSIIKSNYDYIDNY